MSKTIFWDESYKGKAKGGYFVRNDLFKFFRRLKESGLQPVGINVDDNYNLEIIVAYDEEEDDE